MAINPAGLCLMFFLWENAFCMIMFQLGVIFLDWFRIKNKISSVYNFKHTDFRLINMNVPLLNSLRAGGTFNLTGRGVKTFPIQAMKACMGSRCIAPVLNFCTSWRWVVDVKPRLLYHQGEPRYPLDKNVGRSQSHSWRSEKEKKSLSPKLLSVTKVCTFY